MVDGREHSDCRVVGGGRHSMADEDLDTWYQSECGSNSDSRGRVYNDLRFHPDLSKDIVCSLCLSMLILSNV